MTMILGNWNFYGFFVFFGKWANVIWVMNMKPLNLLSQGRSVPLFLFHPPYIFLSCIYSFLPLWQCVCPQTLWRKQPLSILFLFVLYLFLSIWLETRWQPFHLTGSIGSPSCHRCLVSLFLHSKHTPPSIFLFFLNVIVKCSSEMTLNMCTLTEGIHLVIYFLIPVSRGLFTVSVSLGLIWIYPMKYAEHLPENHHFKFFFSIKLIQWFCLKEDPECQILKTPVVLFACQTKLLLIFVLQ